jgi:uncharacterized membrane protein YgcG
LPRPRIWIDRAELRLHGLEGLVWNNVRIFTGPQGSLAGDARIIAQVPGFLDVVTTGPLSPYEGLTVEALFPKGVLRQPSQLQVAAHLVSDNLALVPSFLGVVGIVFYVGWLFLYGTARPPGAIVPQFAPPNGFSAAMVGYLEDKGWLLDRDFSAGIVGLAVARHLKLIHGDGTYRLVRQEGGEPVTELETQFEGALFREGDELSLSDWPRVVGARAELDNFMRGAVMPVLLHKEPRNVRPARTIAIAAIVLTVTARAIEYGASEVVGFTIISGLSVVGALILATAALARGQEAFAVIDTGTGGTHRVQLLAYQLARRRWGIAVIGLPMLVLGLAGAHLGGTSLFLAGLCLAATAALARASWCLRLTVPTAEGWKRRDEIEGLKLFLGVAEADRLRVLNPPDFTPALYEKLLPYAIALGVEMVWSRRFAGALAASQIQYEPDWYDGSHPWNRSDTADFSSDLGGGLTTAIAAASTTIAAASTAPSSSDGWSGGGGGSDDGGGGGGSGW